MSSYEKIRVFARVRPSKEEHKVVHATHNNIAVNVNGKEKTFSFDGVFGEDSTQEDIYNFTASRIIQGTLQGYNGTIFAYGQTGSGKTFTMIGPPSKYSQSRSTIFDEQSGIIPRGLQSLFELLEKKKEEMPNTFTFNVSISFIEIYNDCVFDLIVRSDEKLKIGQDHEGNAMVKGSTERIVKDFCDAMTEVKSGWSNRTWAETKMNRSSSRSHALLLIKIRTEEVHGSISTARSAFLNLVDLAGSEGMKQLEGERLKEATHINGSLLHLKNVIRELSDKKNKGGFINFRNSALTHILKDSLGGNARTAVMINVHPDKIHYSETLSTLTFASEVGKIENRVVVNEDLKGDSVTAFKAEIRRLTDEIEKMKSESTEEVAKIQATLAEWIEAANKFERQLAVSRRKTINAAIVAGGDAAATFAEKVWAENMREAAENVRHSPSSNNIRSTQLLDLKNHLNLLQFEKEELMIQLDEEKKLRMDIQKKYTRCLEERRSPMKDEISLDSHSPQNGPSAVSSMLGDLATPEVTKKEKKRTRRNDDSKTSQNSDANRVEGRVGEIPRETGDNVQMIEMGLKLNKLKEKHERLDQLVKTKDNEIFELEEKLCFAIDEKEKLKCFEVEKKKADRKVEEMRDMLSLAERRETDLNVELIGANSKAERLNAELHILKWIHDEKLKEMEEILKTNNEKDMKEMNLKLEVVRLKEALRKLRNEVEIKESEMQALDGDKSVLKDKLEALEKEKNDMADEMESARSRISDLLQELEQQKAQLQMKYEKDLVELTSKLSLYEEREEEGAEEEMQLPDLNGEERWKEEREEIEEEEESEEGETSVEEDDRMMKIELLSPVGSGSITFAIVRGGDNRAIISDMKIHLQKLFELCPRIKKEFEKKTKTDDWISRLNWSDVQQCSELINKLNKSIKDVVNLKRPSSRGYTDSSWFMTRCSSRQLEQINRFCMNRVAKSVQAKPETYLYNGRALPSMESIREIIIALNMGKEDVFVHLGSRVGNVVTYASAYTQAKKCIGIEDRDECSRMAVKMKREFESELAWYGKKKHRPIEFLHGDFLLEHQQLLFGEATVLYIDRLLHFPSFSLLVFLNKIFAQTSNRSVRVAYCKPKCSGDKHYIKQLMDCNIDIMQLDGLNQTDHVCWILTAKKNGDERK